MGWDSSGIKLTAPISLGDISVATGVGGDSYDLGDMISTGTLINPAAKFKPIAYPVWGVLTEAQRKAHNCGLSMTLYSSLSALWAAAMNMSPGALAWNYEKPRGFGGVLNEPFRVLDFDGYFKPSVFEFQYGFLPNPTNTASVRLTNEHIMITQDCIHQSDLQGNGDGAPNGTYINLSGYNFGVAIAESGASGPQWVKTFADSAVPFQITLPNAGSANKTYNAVLFFTNQTFNGETTDKSGNYALSAYPLTSVLYQPSAPVLDLEITGSMSSNKTSISIGVATRSGTKAFYMAKVVVMDNGSEWASNTAYRSTDSPFTTTEKSYNHTYNSAIPDSATFILRVYSDSTNYQDQSFIIMRPI